jgi:hypothetical protein
MTTTEKNPGTDLAVRKPAEPEPLSERNAQALDKKIRATGEKLDTTADTFADLLEQAAFGQIHTHLSFPSWTAYVRDVVKESRFLQLVTKDRTDRKALVIKMYSMGMSQRAIADALGASKKTVQNDLAEVDKCIHHITEGVDGKQYTSEPESEDDDVIDGEVIGDVERQHSSGPKPAPEPKKPPLTEDFDYQFQDLQSIIAEFKPLLEDERYPKARRRIANAHLSDLHHCISRLEVIADELAAEVDA